MEIKRVGENKIRCALTEDEIREMGFDIDEIIGNGEATQKFMRVVLKIVEEQENISLENISPMVKAELLSDHSMAITFGGDSDLSFQQLMDAISDLVGQMTPEKMQEFRNLSKEERQGVLDAFLDQKKDTQEQRVAEEKQEKENKKLTSRHTKIFETFERFRCKNKQKRYSENGKYGKNAVKSCKFVDKKRFQ